MVVNNHSDIMYTFLSTQVATEQLHDDAVEEHRCIQHAHTQLRTNA